jgi:hypothetical protein
MQRDFEELKTTNVMEEILEIVNSQRLKTDTLEIRSRAYREAYTDAVNNIVSAIKNLVVKGDVSKSGTCENCEEECEPISLGSMCDKCYVEL